MIKHAWAGLTASGLTEIYPWTWLLGTDLAIDRNFQEHYMLPRFSLLSNRDAFSLEARSPRNPLVLTYRAVQGNQLLRNS